HPPFIRLDLAQRFLVGRLEGFSALAKSARPFGVVCSAEIAASPGKALTTFRFLPIYGDTFRYFVLRKTSDEIGGANGWKFHVDGVHLNRRGGMLLAGLVQDFLDS